MFFFSFRFIYAIATGSAAQLSSSSVYKYEYKYLYCSESNVSGVFFPLVRYWWRKEVLPKTSNDHFIRTYHHFQPSVYIMY